MSSQDGRSSRVAHARGRKTGSFLQRLRAAIACGASIAKIVQLFNQQHAVVRESGRTTIITETLDPMLNRRVLQYGSFGDLRNLYLPFRLEVGESKRGEPQYKSVADLWLAHPDRRQYEGIVFAPGSEQPGYFNLWRGFAVESKSGDWSLMAAHIRDVICHGDERVFRYVMGWMACRIQCPGKQAEVALVMRGARGSGKGVFARQFGSLFGQHFVHVSNLRHLTGNFNAHLRDAVLIFADEAFGTTGRTGEGVLKMLITEPRIPIERKGRDVEFVNNCAGVLVASNSDWVIPAGLDERRFCVLDVSGAWAQNHEYFGALVDQMDHGGREAMLFDLTHRDLADVNLRDVPVTAALQEQKMFSMRPHERWWFEKLRDGCLLPTHQKWESEALRDDLHADYAASLGKIRTQATVTELGMYLSKLVPGLDQKRRAAPHSKIRKWYWVFPPLVACRAYFDRLTRSQHSWPPEEPQGG